jgi:hypothetical protein
MFTIKQVMAHLKYLKMTAAEVLFDFLVVFGCLIFSPG